MPSTRAAVALLALAFCAGGVDAIYKDDAGVLDFSVATAGHGAIGWARTAGSGDHEKAILLTTDLAAVSSQGTSCYVAGRSTQSGGLLWRRNVCSVPNAGAQAHAVAMGSGEESVFYTVDHTGVARAWKAANGDLLWDAKVVPGARPRIFAPDGLGYVAVASGTNELVLLDAGTGSLVDTIDTGGSGPRDGQVLEWLSVEAATATASASSSLSVAFARVQASDGSFQGSDFYTGTYQVGSGGSLKVGAGTLKGSSKNLLADTVRISGDDVWAVTADGAIVHNHEVSMASEWRGDWDRVVGVEPTGDPLVVSVSGSASAGAESTMDLFRYDAGSSSWKQVSSSDGVGSSAAALCPVAGLVVETPLDRSVRAYESASGKVLAATGDVFGADGDSVAVVSVLEESAGGATVLIGTERGTTTVFSVTKAASGDSVAVSVLWTAEEGLSSLSSAIILDASHLGSDDLVEEQDSVAYRLSLAGRLKAQWQDVEAMLFRRSGTSAASGGFQYRDHLFGFLKVSALLSPKAHRLWGMRTWGEGSGSDEDARGSILWSLDLPKNALWHSMVHGTTNAARAAHGIHGDTHSREILVLSASADKIDWMCIDGTSGAVNAQDSVPVRAPVLQVLPVYGSAGSGGCRQAALLLGDDMSLTAVPGDAQTRALVQSHLHKTPNGLYTHKIDRVANKVESFRVSSALEEGFVAQPVGLTSFGGEQIAEVAYPLRHEDMQSMSTILGDNSLLLKYINPHMVVVVTMLSEAEQQSTTDVARALSESSSKPRKPAGAAAPGSSSTATSPQPLPNMFVNLVDTVSGRVLYRHGHSGVDPGKKVSVVVSENWVVYSYVSEKTRRTEIGVLTLHEGMIEPKGLTYFSRPEQSSSFSSFDARESKPVVLSKVYAFPKTVTALGVTRTRQGISRQNILVAASDGSLSTINKMMLETRRPVGEAKPEEKKEGLVPYQELIPATPLFSLNYNQTMEPFTSIVSSTTSLESQSLVFGFGGPDLFFTRTSPTKGFDLLPETFNKVLVAATTVGIVAALLTVQRMGQRKALKQSWA